MELKKLIVNKFVKKKKDWLIFLEDLADRPYGIRCFRLLDPNKNDIVIFSYLKDLEEKGLL